MPCADENGLLPGLAIGRGIPIPCADENGLLPGLGIPVSGVCAGAGAAAAFSCLGSTFASSAGFSSTTSGLAFALVDLAAVFFGAGLASGRAARNLAATGGAIVDEPPFTYSPSSSSLASATLVSIPSSLAMSYTRGSANYFLLSGANPNRAGLIAERNSFRATHLLFLMSSACIRFPLCGERQV